MKSIRKFKGLYDRYKVIKNDLDNIEVYLYKAMNLIPKTRSCIFLEFR